MSEPKLTRINKFLSEIGHCSRREADKLIELGVSKHWDDDEDEVAAAEDAGIEAVLVPVEGDITDRLRDKWLDHMAKSEQQTN